MYIPEKFREERTEVLHGLMRAHPLATLVAMGESGIIANHVPLEINPEPAPFGTLRGHIARANPLWKQYRPGSEVLAVFHGPQRYISPNLYATKRETGEVVPTWNYAVVHARGVMNFKEQAGWLRQLVTRLTDSQEAVQSAPWKVTDAPEAFTQSMLDIIVGFELSIASLMGKFKLSQNRTDPDRRGVLGSLESSSDPDAREMAGMLGLE
ncbi:MAG TPA: FMN-binding negative transcriptional regulator [Steroidobacteraceae bacterium]|jgi:transcriptional regulator